MNFQLAKEKNPFSSGVSLSTSGIGINLRKDSERCTRPITRDSARFKPILAFLFDLRVSPNIFL